MKDRGKWLSINEYSSYREISISTIRRYIKSGQVQSKKENGRYYIFVTDENYERNQLQKEKETFALKLENENLKRELKRVQEELSEAQMLITIYESKSNTTSELPPLPLG